MKNLIHLKQIICFQITKQCFLLNSSLNLDINELCGMELINNEIDLDTNLQIENYSKNKTVYAIGSVLIQDEPLFLIKVDNYSNGIVILKYIPDSDAEIETINPKITDNQRFKL